MNRTPVKRHPTFAKSRRRKIPAAARRPSWRVYWRSPWRFSPWRYRWAAGRRLLLKRQWRQRLNGYGLSLNAPQLHWQRNRGGQKLRQPRHRNGFAAHWLRYPWRAGRRQKRGRSWRDDLRQVQYQQESRWEQRQRWLPRPFEEQQRRRAQKQRAAAARRRRRRAKGLRLQPRPSGPHRAKASYRRWRNFQPRRQLQQRRRHSLSRRVKLLGTPLRAQQPRCDRHPRRRRSPPPLNWRLLSHRFGFWVHFIHYPKQRYRLQRLRRKLLWAWQRPRRPGQLPRPRGNPPVIPLLSEALNPPPIPPPGPTAAANLRYAGRHWRGWSAAPTLGQPRRPSRRRRRQSLELIRWGPTGPTGPARGRTGLRFTPRRRRLSRRFESRRLAASSSSRGVSWSPGRPPVGRLRPARRPRQQTFGRCRGWYTRRGLPLTHQRKPAYLDHRLHRASEPGDGPQYRGYRSLRRGGMHGIRHLTKTTPLRRPLQQLNRLGRLRSNDGEGLRDQRRRWRRKLRSRRWSATQLRRRRRRWNLPRRQRLNNPRRRRRQLPSLQPRLRWFADQDPAGRRYPTLLAVGARCRSSAFGPGAPRQTEFGLPAAQRAAPPEDPPLWRRHLIQDPLHRRRPGTRRRRRWARWRWRGLVVDELPRWAGGGFEPSRQQHEELRYWAPLLVLHQRGLDSGEKSLTAGPGGPLRLRGDPEEFDVPPERRWPRTYITENPLWLWSHLWSSANRLLAEFHAHWRTVQSEFYGTMWFFPRPGATLTPPHVRLLHNRQVSRVRMEFGQPVLGGGPDSGAYREPLPRKFFWSPGPLWGNQQLLWGSPLRGQWQLLEPYYQNYRGLEYHSRWGYLRLPLCTREQELFWMVQRGSSLARMERKTPDPWAPGMGKWCIELLENHWVRVPMRVRPHQLRRLGLPQLEEALTPERRPRVGGGILPLLEGSTRRVVTGTRQRRRWLRFYGRNRARRRRDGRDPRGPARRRRRVWVEGVVQREGWNLQRLNPPRRPRRRPPAGRSRIGEQQRAERSWRQHQRSRPRRLPQRRHRWCWRIYRRSLRCPEGDFWKSKYYCYDAENAPQRNGELSWRNRLYYHLTSPHWRASPHPAWRRHLWRRLHVEMAPSAPHRRPPPLLSPRRKIPEPPRRHQQQALWRLLTPGGLPRWRLWTRLRRQSPELQLRLALVAPLLLARAQNPTPPEEASRALMLRPENPPPSAPRPSPRSHWRSLLEYRWRRSLGGGSGDPQTQPFRLLRRRQRQRPRGGPAPLTPQGLGLGPDPGRFCRDPRLRFAGPNQPQRPPQRLHWPREELRRDRRAPLPPPRPRPPGHWGNLWPGQGHGRQNDDRRRFPPLLYGLRRPKTLVSRRRRRLRSELRRLRRPRRRRHWPTLGQRHRLRRSRRRCRRRWVHPQMGTMTRWLRRVSSTWRKQRQRQWLQRRKGQVGAPLVQYHLIMKHYYPPLLRQQRQRRPRNSGFFGGTPPLPSLEPLTLPQGLPPLARTPLRRAPPGYGRHLRKIWTAKLPVRRQKGRFVWAANKHPLLAATAKEKRRARRQRSRQLRRRLRQIRTNRKPRPDHPQLLPQPGTRLINRERIRRWRQARYTGRRLWWLRWRERERWYWRLCRWAGLGHKGKHQKRLRFKFRPRLYRPPVLGRPWGFHQHLPKMRRFVAFVMCYKWRFRWLRPGGLWALQRRLRWRPAGVPLRLALPGAQQRWRSGLGYGWRWRRRRRRPEGHRWSRRQPRRRYWNRGGRQYRNQLARHRGWRLNRRLRQLRDRRNLPRRLRRWLLQLPKAQKWFIWRRLPRRLRPGLGRRRRRKPAHLNRRFGPFRRLRHLRARWAFNRWSRRRRRRWRQPRRRQLEQWLRRHRSGLKKTPAKNHFSGEKSTHETVAKVKI